MISKDTIIVVLVTIALPLVWFVWPRPNHGVRVYDCSIAEISPDYPVDVKNECRRIRADKIK
jgi:hypothetical protein